MENISTDQATISDREVTPLDWTKDDPISYAGMVKLQSTQDHSSLLHSILKAYSLIYITQEYKGQRLDRCSYIRKLREDLANQLSKPTDASRPDSPTLYETLNGGTMDEIAKYNSSYSLSSMQDRLRNDQELGVEYIEFLSNLLDKDIYVLDEMKRSIFPVGVEPKHLYKGRKSIVIIYSENISRYDLVGLLEGGRVKTYFRPANPFIVMLRTQAKKRPSRSHQR